MAPRGLVVVTTGIEYVHHHGAYKNHKHPHKGSHKPRPGARHKRGPEKHPRAKGLKHPHKGVHEHHHVTPGRRHPHRGVRGPRVNFTPHLPTGVFVSVPTNNNITERTSIDGIGSSIPTSLK